MRTPGVEYRVSRWSTVVRVAALVVLASGCGRFGFEAENDGGAEDDAHVVTPADASVDAPVITPSFPFQPSNGISPDLALGDLAYLQLNGPGLLNTDTGEITDESAGQIRAAGTGVIAGIRFDIAAEGIGVFGVSGMTVGEGADVRVMGENALGIVSLGDVFIVGRIDLSAGVCPDGVIASMCAGPGGGNAGTITSLAVGCGPGGPGASDGDTGGGGGALGGPAAPGGDETDENLAPGGAAGETKDCPGTELVPLAGGSGGGHGGGAPETGGGGGGAIQISAGTWIKVNGGGIHAGGAGGEGSTGHGGGGGGSGGAILLEAPEIILSGGVLAANGGGGGEGSGFAPGEAGRFDAEPAAGGFSGGNRGGDGASSLAAATAGAPDINDTGGGGGGAGLIRLNATTLDTSGTILSPDPSQGPLPSSP